MDTLQNAVDQTAVITDVHANLPALRAVLDRIDALGIERVYCGGDLVGYGPHPNEVCALIAEPAGRVESGSACGPCAQVRSVVVFELIRSQA